MTPELVKLVVEVVKYGFLLAALVVISLHVLDVTSFKPVAKLALGVVKAGFVLVTLAVIGLRVF
jgi:hypothetical protein